MRTFTSFEQTSLDWSLVRAGMVTASGCESLFTPKWKIKEGGAVDTYLAEIVAERWMDGPLPSFTPTHQVEDGKFLEEQARNKVALELDCDIQQVAFLANDDLTCGASPDGLIGEDAGLELKCPAADTHVGYLLDDVVPDAYIQQVHFSLYVSGRTRWHFVSYRYGFPLFHKVVERDQHIIDVIEEGVTNFLARVDQAYRGLVYLNNGCEPAKNPMRQEILKYGKSRDYDTLPVNESTTENCDLTP